MLVSNRHAAASAASSAAAARVLRLAMALLLSGLLSSAVWAPGVGAAPLAQAGVLITVDDVVAPEASGASAVFTLRLSQSSAQPVGVQLDTVSGSALAGQDFVPRSVALSFAPGQTSLAVPIGLLGDALDEPDETFFVNLSLPSNAALGDGQGSGLILDDDAPPALLIGDVSTPEGTSSTMVASFNVLLTQPSGKQVTVNVATANQSAVAGSDYQPRSQTLVFPPGVTSVPVPVTLVPDTLDELDETYVVNLMGPTNATIADGQGLGTIVDDDLVEIMVLDAQATEATGASMVFVVRLQQPSPFPVSVSYATSNGTALAGQDYTGGSGGLSFNPGETSKTLAFPILNDALAEPNEVFSLQLLSATNARIGDGVAVGTILDDADGPPSLAIGDVSLVEGLSGSVVARFSVTLSRTSAQVVSASYATANQSAAAGSDYAAASGTLSFPAGTTSATIDVAIFGDSVDELNETFVVNLSAPANAVLGDGQGLGTIVDDDLLEVRISDAQSTEATGASMAFTVQLQQSSPNPVSVSYATSNGTALAGQDYTAASGTLTFAPGETSKTLAIPLLNDALDEANEVFSVQLASAVNATIADGQGLGTILDDADAPPGLRISDASVTEGTGSTVSARFTVTLAQPSGQTVTVGYATAPGSAASGSDYASASGTLTFSPGQTSKAILVSVIGDPVDEPDETFFANLSVATNAGILDGQGQALILDNDGPAVTISGVTVAEPPSGSSTPARFTVLLSAPSFTPVTVSYGTRDGSASAGSDYQALTGSLTIPAGATSATITVMVNGDNSLEGDETFTVVLQAISPGTLGSPSSATGTIKNTGGLPL